MAEAIIGIKIVEQVVKTEVKEFILKLSIEEAQFIADMTATVGGSSETTRRKHADNIRAALLSSELIEVHFGQVSDMDGSLYCRPVYK